MPTARSPRSLTALAGALACAAAAVAAVSVPSAAASGTAHERVVSDSPAAWTPHALDGSVTSIVRTGDTVYAAGDFSRVSTADRSRTLRRDGVFAYQHGTGRILDFAPEVEGTVVSLVAAEDGGVYLGGSFTEAGGVERRGVALLDAGGRVQESFDAELDGGSVYRLARHGADLYVAGSFGGAGSGGSPPALARVDAASGARDTGFAITVADQRKGTLRVQDMGLSPDGSRLVIGGTFMSVDGQRRPQIAMIDTGSARLSDWSTEAYAADCDYSRMHTYVRQIDFAPDGSYFAVATSGGPEIKPGLCKTAARWEAEGAPGAEPTWVNHTGGDSVYAVEATGAAVYVGGHQRWMDNPEGDHDAGPGAVEREGIAAIDPGTGKALPWNPGRARGHGAEALTATADGLYVGSDTTRLGGERRDRLGFFPLA